MTSTPHIPARFLIATATLTGLALLTVGCGSSSPKATPAASTTTAATTAATDANDSPFCRTARAWMVHEFNGEGESFAGDPVAFEKYWTEYVDFVATAEAQSPAEIKDDWSTGYDFLVTKFTPILEKYGYDIERAKEEGTPAELEIGAQVENGPSPVQQRAQEAVHAYEGTVCDTAQPAAADESFDGVTPNDAYCKTVAAGNEAVGEQIIANKWSVDAVRAFVTSDAYAANLDAAEANAPAEIKADVIADAEWSRNQQADVIAKYGYDARKLFLEGTQADRQTFQHSDPAVADHYARTIAYEEQVCGEE